MIRCYFPVLRLLLPLIPACLVLTGEGCSSSDSSAETGFQQDINTDLYNLPIAIDDSYDTSMITNLLSSEQVINDTGGGLALILVKDGKLVYRRGFGSFENDIDKAVPIASATKWISAAVVAKLMDAGSYDRNDLVTDYYPYFDGVTPAPLPAPEGFFHDHRMERMTIAQLFSHTSGLSYQPEIQRRHEISSIQSAVAQIYFHVPMDFEPGTFVQYAGVGMQIVGGISEVVLQKSWVDIFMEQIAIPLGMTSTDYYGYVAGEIITDNPNIAGSIRTNVDDYMRILYMIYNNGIFNGEEILSENAVQAITTSYSESLSVVRSPFEPYYPVAPETMLLETGLGNWLLDDDNNNPRYVVSGGAWGCMPFIDYERNLVGIYLPYNTDVEFDPETRFNINPATMVFFRDLKPLLDQVFAN